MSITSPFLSMFGKSPLKPLQKHIYKVHDAAKTLDPFFEAVFKQDWETAEQYQNKIADFEKDADEIKRDLRLHLPKGLFLPVPRTDILELLSVQDQIANKAEDIAGLVFGRRMQIPSAILEDFNALLQRSIDASKQARKAISELDELLESGFRGNEVKIVEEMIVKLGVIETDTDDIQIKIRKSIFSLEPDLPPIDVIFLYKVVERIGDLADSAQRVGGRLEILLAR